MKRTFNPISPTTSACSSKFLVHQTVVREWDSVDDVRPALLRRDDGLILTTEDDRIRPLSTSFPAYGLLTVHAIVEDLDYHIATDFGDTGQADEAELINRFECRYLDAPAAAECTAQWRSIRCCLAAEEGSLEVGHAMEVRMRVFRDDERANRLCRGVPGVIDVVVNGGEESAAVRRRGTFQV